MHGWLRLVAAILTGALAIGCAPAGPEDGEVGQPSGPSQAESGERPAPGGSTQQGHDERREPRREGGGPDGGVAGGTDGDGQLPDGTVLAWTRGELPADLVEVVADHPAVAAVTVVEVATAGLVRTTGADGEPVDQTTEGRQLPVEVLAVDPASYQRVTGLAAVGRLGDGAALLSETSAQVRGLGAGARLTFAGGGDHEVVDVAADRLVGAAEVMVAVEDAPDDAVPRYLLARPAEDAGDDVGEELAGVLPDDVAVRLRSRGETPVLRHADAVTAPARLKSAFGEFALREADGRAIDQEPGWVDEHVTAAEVPLLGTVTCHRDAIAPLRAAMEELERRGEADLVDPSLYGGCWAPRFQDVTGPLSTHAWGVAIDLDPAGLPQDSDAEPPAVLVEVMAEHGFTNGAGWLLPDPMHFELVPDRDPS